MLLQDAKSRELVPDFFAAFPRHDDTPRPHDSAIPRLAVKDFRTQANRRARFPRQSRACDRGGKENSLPAILTSRWGNSSSTVSGLIARGEEHLEETTRAVVPTR